MEHTYKDQHYEYWFANIKGIGDKKKRYLRSTVHLAKELYCEGIKPPALQYLTEQEQGLFQRSIKSWKLEQEYETLKTKNIHFITYRNPAYPKRLLDLASPPYALYIKGELPDEDRPAIAIVGARKCSPYGEFYAHEFGAVLGRLGVQIISGLAKGIDGIGQRSAIEENGRSFGVLACDVDTCYPREHLGLYMDLQEHGGVISEQPLGTPALPSYFPARNRIISGLADVILVIEAKEKSGSLITADMALEQGKDVYALPGPVNSALSQGCNRLIKQGAGILISPEDLLEELQICYGQKAKYLNGYLNRNKITLESTENIVYSCLDLKPKNLNQLIEEVNLSIPELMNLLISLELKGLIKEISKNYYVKIK